MRTSFISAVFVLGISIPGAIFAQGGERDVLLWSFATESGVNASPVVHQGVLYVGSLDSSFYAIDAASGDEVWRFKTGNRIYSTAAIDDGMVCFESGNVLYGLDLKGEEQWRFTLYEGKVKNQQDSWDYFHSSPEIVDGIGYIGTEKGLVYGVDVKTGREVFQCQTPGGEHAIRTKPGIAGGRIFFGDWNGVMYAYDLDSAEMAWSYDSHADDSWGWVPAIQAAPVFMNEAVYFTGRSCILYSMNVEDGTKNWTWRDPNKQWISGGVAIEDGLLFVGESDQHLFFAFDAASGEEVWRFEMDYNVFGTPTVQGEYIYFGTGNAYNSKQGSVYVIDRENGEEVYRFEANGNIHSSPAVQDGMVYFGCSDGKVYALDQQRMLPHPTGVLEERGVTPTGVRLWQNYPNPFNAETVFRFNLREPSQTELAIYDMAGQRVRGLVAGVWNTGAHQVVWDSRDDRGMEVASGSYVAQLAGDSFREKIKIVLLR